MLFHMVALVLLYSVAILTIFLLAENLQQNLQIRQLVELQWGTNLDYHVKEHKNLYQKLVSKVSLHFV